MCLKRKMDRTDVLLTFVVCLSAYCECVYGDCTTILLLCPGTRISTFTQADLASRSIQYVHTSEEEKHADQFSFTVSDGTNEVNKRVNSGESKKVF